MKKNINNLTRRQLLKAGMYAGAGMMLPFRFLPAKAFANNHQNTACDILDCTTFGLSDPFAQHKFVNHVPNALDPGFKYTSPNGKYKINIRETVQFTGLVDTHDNLLPTPIWGYGDQRGPTWPGRTFEVRSGDPVEVMWKNQLKRRGGHLFHVDTSLHWSYSLPGYEHLTIENDGVPIIPHLHGGHTDYQFDGNPEFFFTPGWSRRGPQWLDKKFIYDNSQMAGTLWYHDHALGITRLNVYAGLAGFYILRDDYDTGLSGNDLGLPAFPYEVALAIQDRMFKANGELFYPAFPGDPFYADFITDETVLPNHLFPDGGPTALAEFFGDHMVVNGVIWPKMDVEPRNYRLRLLNGCDSRFLAIQFFEVGPTDTDFDNAIGPLNFTVIGSDQGLASEHTIVTSLLCETGSRYDIIFDFKTVNKGNRVIMKNIGGDEPFGGDIPGPQVFGETDRIMAFDVKLPFDYQVQDDVSFDAIRFGPVVPDPEGGKAPRVRKVALFEGMDEFKRLQPLLGTAEPATDYNGDPINWPAAYKDIADLEGQMNGSMAWHSPTTENPRLGTTEVWEIWNATGDAHPVHLHLVHFEVLGRQEIKWDTYTDTLEDGDRVIPKNASPDGNGTYLRAQKVVQHNGVKGDGFRFEELDRGYGEVVDQEQLAEYVENAPKDMVTALPGQITRIKAHFDKPGRYVWHCHILSHEDHEMMRVLYVEPEPLST